MLVLSAVKIIAAKKAGRFFRVHLACDSNGEGWMCQAAGSEISAIAGANLIFSPEFFLMPILSCVERELLLQFF
jgi:hypothetical protein